MRLKDTAYVKARVQCAKKQTFTYGQITFHNPEWKTTILIYKDGAGLRVETET